MGRGLLSFRRAFLAVAILFGAGEASAQAPVRIGLPVVADPENPAADRDGTATPGNSRTTPVLPPANPAPAPPSFPPPANAWNGPAIGMQPPLDGDAAWKARIAALEMKLESLEKSSASKPAPASPAKLDASPNTKMEARWDNGLKFTNADKSIKWTVGGVIQYDMSFFKASHDINRSIGLFNGYADPNLGLQDGFEFRRARIRFSGEAYDQFEWYAQYDFAQALDLRRTTLGLAPGSKTPVPANPINYDFDPGDDVAFNEVYVGITKLPMIGTVRIGRHRESLNFVTSTSDNNQVWLERGLMFDAFNGDFNFSNGVTVQNTYLNSRVYTCSGFFHSNNNTNRGFFAVGDGEYCYDERVTCLPIYDEDEQRWLHLGADYSYRNPHAYQLRYRARDMVRTGASFESPNMVNTGTIFTQDAQQIFNLEYAMSIRRFTLAAECTTSWVTNAFTGGLPNNDGTLPAGSVYRGTYSAWGGYVEMLYFLTPDHRKYQLDRPGYARVTPNSNFVFRRGDDDRIRFNVGALEIGARYDYVDLINNGINGGASNAATVCINWYLNSNFRIQANYFWQNRVFAPDNIGANLPGEVQGFGLRFNADF